MPKQMRKPNAGVSPEVTPPAKRSFAAVREAHRHENTNYRSIMDRYRRTYRITKVKAFRCSFDELGNIVLTDFLQFHHLDRADLFVKFEWVKKYDNQSAVRYRIEEFRERGTKNRRPNHLESHLEFSGVYQKRLYTTIFKVYTPLFGPRHRTKIAYIERVSQELTIQGFDGMLEKSLFRINIFKRGRKMKQAIAAALSKTKSE